MLASTQTIEVVVNKLEKHGVKRIVLDPVSQMS